MHDLADIEGKLAELISEVSLGRLLPAQVAPEASLLGDLGLDSLDYATVMLGCEQWLGSRVAEDRVDWRQVVTVRELATLLHASQR